MGHFGERGREMRAHTHADCECHRVRDVERISVRHWYRLNGERHCFRDGLGRDGEHISVRFFCRLNGERHRFRDGHGIDSQRYRFRLDIERYRLCNVFERVGNLLCYVERIAERLRILCVPRLLLLRLWRARALPRGLLLPAVLHGPHALPRGHV